jgi:hypothetical protein
MLLISPMGSFASADVEKRSTSIKVKKQSPRLAFVWVAPGMGILFTMAFRLPDDN